MKLRPLSNRVLVKQDNPEEVSAGGIIIAENARQRSRKGTVVEVGPGLLTDVENPDWNSGPTSMGERFVRMPMPLKAGDRVIFQQYQASEIEIDGEKLLLLNLDEVLAVIE